MILEDRVIVREFTKNPRYLSYYYLKTLVFVALLILLVISNANFLPSDLIGFGLVIILVTSPNIIAVMLACLMGLSLLVFNEKSSGLLILQMVLGIAVTLMSTGLLHSVSHRSIKPRWLNRPLGELCGLFQLSGFPEWTITHFLHHRYADQVGLDPHPPRGLNFIDFLLAMRTMVMSAFLQFFLKTHGDNKQTRRILFQTIVLVKATNLLKSFFWFIVFGPMLFVTVFVCSQFFKMVHYAWFNYRTHQNEEIVDLNKGIYYFLNYLTFGLYVHGTHHRFPSAFDPRQVKEKKLVE